MQIELFGFMGSEAHTQPSAVSTGLHGICTKEHSLSFLLNLDTVYQEYFMTWIQIQDTKLKRTYKTSNLEHC